MSITLNLTLSDELRAFVDGNSGDGTLYVTPSEFVRHVLREKKEQLDAARIRNAILDGFQDAIHGRTVLYDGDVGYFSSDRLTIALRGIECNSVNNATLAA